MMPLYPVKTAVRNRHFKQKMPLYPGKNGGYNCHFKQYKNRRFM